jgi:23S rRNA pseudouridine1911/1915/1917 synthase
MSKSIIVDEENKRKRFDVVATEMLPSLSRAYIRTLIDEGRILLNDQLEKPGYRLRLDDKLTTDFEEKELEQIPDIELPIIFEDKDVLVINKPAGVISHSRGKYWNESSVASFVRQKTGQPGERSGIVHRLDRATSGVMVCAKNVEALSWLQKQFSDRNVKKSYVAIVAGHLKPKEAIMDLPIERNPKAPATFRVGANGKHALTHYTVIKSGESHDLVSLKPTTGRTHQLRVHLAHQNHPIVGDNLYDGEEADRLYLHAESLELTLPNRTRQTFSVPVPKEFEQHV